MLDQKKECGHFQLRRAHDVDVERLHLLMSAREVNRYLADDSRPTIEFLRAWVARSDESFASCGVGLWLLESPSSEVAGCVFLEADAADRIAELTYALAPSFWHQGFATRMSWTVIRLAFASNQIDRITAAADEPNRASLAVMRRLGMSELRRVAFPLYPGFEYVLHRDDPTPVPMPEEIAFV